MATNRDNIIILLMIITLFTKKTEKSGVNTVVVFCLDPSTVISSNSDVLHAKILLYINLENVNKCHCDGTASGGLTFWTDTKKLEALDSAAAKR